MSKITDTDEETIKQLLENGSDKAKRKALEESNKELKKNIGTIEGKIDNVVNAIANGTITQERAKSKIQDFERQMENLNLELTANNKKIQDMKELENNIAVVEEKWHQATFDRMVLRYKLDSLSFAQKQILLKQLFEDGSLKMYPIARDKIPNIPSDENMEDYGIFFGEKSKKVGLEVRIDPALNPHKILNILDLLQNNTIHNNNIAFRKGCVRKS